MSTLSHAAARQIVRDAWQQIWGRPATEREALYAAAIAYLETGYGRASQFGTLADRGQYNWGALETRPNADGDCPAGTAPGGDQGSVCFYVYPSDTAAAAAFLKTLTKKHWPVVDAMRGEPIDVARAMRVPPPYYTGTAGTDEQRAQTYAKAIAGAIRAMGEPVPTGQGPAPGSSSSSTLLLLALLGGLGYAAYRYKGNSRARVPKFA